MIKMASGVAAELGGPRGFMWAMMALVAVGIGAAFWMSYMTVPLIAWLTLNGGLVLIFAIICGIECGDGHFNWSDIDYPPVVWTLMAYWAVSNRPSWLRFIAWTLLIPAELAATLVLRPITLVVRALLSPMPGGWD